MGVEATKPVTSQPHDAESRGAVGRAFGRVLAARRARRNRYGDDGSREERIAIVRAGLAPHTSFAIPETIDVTTPGVDVAARVERVVVLAIESARSGDGGRVETSIALRDGEVVEIAVRATTRDVEIRIVAPAAAAVEIDVGRPGLLARLAARGIRVRAYEVAARQDTGRQQ